MPKYKVGDRFMFHGAVREIVFVHEASFRYVIVHEEDDEADFVTEDYIDELYTKIEPFFEAGKTYVHTWSLNNPQRDTWEVLEVREVDGKKYAVAIFRNGWTGNRLLTVIGGAFDQFVEVVN